jgi:nucleoside-diphosphate-sugar epimerase
MIDFVKPESFLNMSFSNEVIIDCININNGVEKDIFNCNVNGFKMFIEYLKGNSFSGKYVYVSTISILDDEAVKGSAYVRSKKDAEDYLKASGLDYQIMRISYPFGKNENPQRLLPRLKQQLQSNQLLKITNIKVNLNYVEDVSKAIFDFIGKSREVFVSNNQYVLLGDVVRRMKQKLGSKSEIILENANSNFTPLSESPYACRYDVLDKLEEVLS